jgi:hypothetical protein
MKASLPMIFISTLSLISEIDHVSGDIIFINVSSLDCTCVPVENVFRMSFN